jgi:hypothetical protein
VWLTQVDAVAASVTANVGTAECAGCLRALRNTFLQHHAPLPIVSAAGAATDPFTVVVIGGTGAGKSTLLNALIGEAVLLPTNCMRACTATIIELSYLASARVGERYKATIEFLSEDEWATELEVMCVLINTARNEYKHGTKAAATKASLADWLVVGTPAADACIKMRSVFGHTMEEHIINANFAELKSSPKVKELLGAGAVHLSAGSAHELSGLLAATIDSENETSEGALPTLVALASALYVTYGGNHWQSGKLTIGGSFMILLLRRCKVAADQESGGEGAMGSADGWRSTRRRARAAR